MLHNAGNVLTALRTKETADHSTFFLFWTTPIALTLQFLSFCPASAECVRRTGSVRYSNRSIRLLRTSRRLFALCQLCLVPAKTRLDEHTPVYMRGCVAAVYNLTTHSPLVCREFADDRSCRITM